MTFALRRPAALALAATILAVGPVLVPTAADATATTDVLVYLGDSNADGHYGLYWSYTDGSSRHTIVADSGPGDVLEPQVSPQGDKVAFEYDPKGSGNYGIAIANLDGSALRTLVPAPTDGTWVFAPAWSPDGKTVVFSSAAVDKYLNLSKAKLRTVNATGTPKVADVAGSGGLLYGSYDPADASRLVGVSNSSHTLYLLSGGSAHQIPNTPSAISPRFSPDGTRIAYASGPAYGTRVYVVKPDGTRLAGSRTPSGDTDEYPSWSSDSGTVYFDRRTPAGWGSNTDRIGDLMAMPADGSAAPAAIATAGAASTDEIDPAVVRRDTAAPHLTGVAIRLAGAHPVISWHDADRDFSHVIVRRGTGTVPTSWTYIYNGRSSNTTDTVSVGRVYTYVVTAYDGMGNLTRVTKHMQALSAPATAAPDPVSNQTAGQSFRVYWSGKGNPTGTHYTVDWSAHRPGSTTGWTRWFTGTTATSAVYKPSGTIGGSTFYFRTVVKDGYGNASAAVARAATEPYDDSTVSYSSSWSGHTGESGRWLGTLHIGQYAGAKATKTLTGKRYYLVGDRCPDCGSFKVYVNDAYKATVSAYASSLRTRQVLWTSPTWSLASRTVTVVVVGTSGHPEVPLDAIAGER